MKRKKPQPRPLVVRDRGGRLLKMLSVRSPGRQVGLLRSWISHYGTCVIRRGDTSALVAFSADLDPAAIDCAAIGVEVNRARRRDPRGVFRLADEIFGSELAANRWMMTEIRALGRKRPADLLASPEGVEKVLDVLNRIQYGVLA